MPAGLGGGGWLAIKHETTMGTYLPPTTSGTVWVPILDESFVYTEDKYFSPQIRQQTIVSDVEQSFYHIEGDIHMEVDPSFIPYFLYCSRHTITKDAVTYTPNISYKFAPSSAGSASTAAGASTPKTASITIVRNGVGFGYAGCVMGGFEFTIDNGVLLCTMNGFGLSEETPAGLGTPAWITPDLFGASAHTVYVDTAGTAPAFATPDLNFNGFTFNANYNASAENRLTPDRAATYIAFHETEATYSTELDFINKTEYNNMVAATKRAVRLESLKGGSDFATADSGFRISINNSVYNTYTVNLPNMNDLIMATVEGRAIGIAGGDAYSLEVLTTVDIT
ncbi:MAG TPA: hypothetical protein VGE97_09255 [Nitrososphaera sp.]|jgi:hypothetical protein